MSTLFLIGLSLALIQAPLASEDYPPPPPGVTLADPEQCYEVLREAEEKLRAAVDPTAGWLVETWRPPSGPRVVWRFIRLRESLRLDVLAPDVQVPRDGNFSRVADRTRYTLIWHRGLVARIEYLWQEGKAVWSTLEAADSTLSYASDRMRVLSFLSCTYSVFEKTITELVQLPEAKIYQNEEGRPVYMTVPVTNPGGVTIHCGIELDPSRNYAITRARGFARRNDRSETYEFTAGLEESPRGWRPIRWEHSVRFEDGDEGDRVWNIRYEARYVAMPVDEHLFDARGIRQETSVDIEIPELAAKVAQQVSQEPGARGKMQAPGGATGGPVILAIAALVALVLAVGIAIWRLRTRG